ncbi:MAG: SIMPL domain-containing protein [Acidimicrobiia bacterium]|nr:SIMPL domain-containing protein [Acidimicrobiia bacterium]
MSHTIAVTGTGVAAAAPDVAIVEIGIDVMAKSVSAARRAAATGMAAIIDSLRGNGLRDADMTTTSYAIHPEYDHRDGRRLRGYRVSNAVEARIADLDSVGEVLDAATVAGGDHVTVRGLRFSHSDDAALMAIARSAAWFDAERKAAQLAELAGVTLGGVVAMTEYRSHNGPAPMRAMAVEATAATPIETGERGATVTIDVEFAISTEAASES